MLDEEGSLLGLLIAYNKKGADGKPLINAGFSREFDEPLMNILTTKLIISIKNANLLKKLKDYELIVESTPDPVVICSKKGLITYMNPGAKNLFGDLIGSSVADRYPSDETSTGFERAREIRRLLMKNADKRLRNFETTFTGKNNEVIPISLSVSLLYDEHGKEAGTIGIAKDLREIKALIAGGQALLETHDIDKILNQITQVCLRLPNSVRAYIKQYDEKSDSLVFRASSPKNPAETFPVTSTPKDRGMTGYVFMTQQPLWSNDVSKLPLDRYYAIFKDVKSKIVVPITYIDKETGIPKKRGVISVDSNELNAFSANDVYFLNTLANQAAVALENAHLIASKNTIITKLRAFERVQQAASGKNLVEDQILESISDAVVDILGYGYANISKVDKDTRMIGTIKVRNLPDEFLKSAWHSLDSKDIQAWVVRHKETVYLTGWDDRLDREIVERYNHMRLVRAFIPIIARGEVLGTLETGYDKTIKSEIEKDEIETLQRIVNLAAIGIEQASLLTRLKQDIALTKELEQQLDALNQASIRILNSTTEREAINHIFRSLESIGYHKVMLALVNEESKKIEGKYALGENWKSIAENVAVDLAGNDILAQALRLKSTILSKHCAKDHRCSNLIRKAKIKSLYVIPLLVKEKPTGVLLIDLTDMQDLVRGDEALFHRRMKVVETFASQSAIAIRNIRHLVTIDRLEANIAETAHEFRSPLHNIMTQLGGLKDYLEETRSETEVDRYVNIIQEEINRAKRQVENSLLLSERTQEAMEFDMQDGYVQDVIKTCADAYRLRALERGLRIVVRDSVKHLPKIRFDWDKIEQAITNLIDNAVKYSHFNQYIDITAFDDGKQINVEITDRGLGIPPDEFETIFQGFTRGGTKDKFRYIPGTGLGLKICKEIVEKHGGEIKLVKSAPLARHPDKVQEYQNCETTFRFTLPKFRKEK
jgi:PAS domain S-box-containing protein